MANVVLHYLRCENLESMLHSAGVVSVETLHGLRNKEVRRTALNMKKCCESEWMEVEASAIEHGVLDFSKKDSNGNNGARRDLTDSEIAELPYWPIVFNSNAEVVWQCCWRCNDDPAFFISKLFRQVVCQIFRLTFCSHNGCNLGFNAGFKHMY